MRLHAPLLAAPALLLAIRVASAAPVFDTYGAWGNVTPFEARVLPGGMDATYFNPALLVASRSGVQLGTFVTRESLQIRLQNRPPGVDVSDSIYSARVANADGTTSRLRWRPLPTHALRSARGGDSDTATSAYLMLGTNLHILPDTLAVGFHLLVPTRSFQTQRSIYVDEREQYFSNSLHHELYSDRFETNVVSIAAAAKIVQELSIGLGFLMTSEGHAKNQVFVPDASDQDVVVTDTSVEVQTRFRPYAGFDLQPVASLHVVGTVHLPSGNDTQATNELQLWNYEYEPGRNAFLQTLDMQTHASPLRIAAGIGVRPAREQRISYSAAATVLWTRWSAYRDRHGERPSDPWLDTFSATLGGAIQWNAHRLGLDTMFVPSPVPDQTGRSNYVDSDRLAAALGYALQWQLAGTTFEGCVQLQLHRLLPRSVTKASDARHPVVDEFPDSVDARTGDPIPESAGLQTNNPGYPGFSSDGWLLGGGVSLTARF